jgi:hypothetical protein
MHDFIKHEWEQSVEGKFPFTFGTPEGFPQCQTTVIQAG